MDPRPVEEIVELHAEFERWLRGEGERDLARVESAFGPSFTFVSPRGDFVVREAMLRNLEAAFGTRAVRIRIENVQVLSSSDTTILAVYEEWHDHSTYTTARQASVLFEIDAAGPNGVRWRHVHESWIEPPPTA